MIYTLSIWASVLSFLWFVSRVLRKHRHPPYPPSPKRPWPVIGNALHIPLSRPWLTYTAWGTTHNNRILHLEALGQHIIVLNDLHDAIELMEKRSSLYSDRPHMPLLFMMGHEINTGLLPYGDVWRQHRKTFQQGFREGVIETYHPILDLKSKQFLQRLITHPEGLAEHCEFFAASAVISIVYGYDLESPLDPILILTKRATELANPAALSGSLIINSFPILLNIPKWFPGGGIHEVAAEARKALHGMADMTYQVVIDRMQQGVDKPSLVQRLLKKQKEEGKDDVTVLKAAAATAYSAGVETTTCALGSLLLALAMYPEVQVKARAEILSVIGTTRLPNFEDRPLLPYLEALCQELHRWETPAPIGVPHATTHDDIYQGYFIPKGSLIFFNTWGMSRNPDTYPEPEKFKPERFLNADGSLKRGERSPAFGFGRRICPGRYFAVDIIWLAAARVLSTLEISNPRDPVTGKGIDLEVHQYSDELVSHPPRFVCTIKPVEHAGNLLRNEGE
ncbi:cytochrome P450 [Pluteus cervinus]|uniref:Cytochrome P450 n=1 Tax=Pluteus cervinus TaxID=181527 RepID=A0ACD3B661_9AGAR|nr:cytochrome P450 [Pluteus cervinus]